MPGDGLSSLPAELILRIAEYLDYIDLLPLTAVNSRFRECLSPMIFRIIRVSNDGKSAEFALSMAKKYGRHVNELHFEGFASPADDTDASSLAPRWGPSGSSALPDATRRLLQGQHLPNLRTARIQFMFDYTSEDWIAQEPGTTPGFYDFDAVEWESQIEEHESRWQWRALMSEAWLSLAGNTTIKSLDIVDLAPRPTTAWRRPEFHRFLASLNEVKMSVWGAEHGAGWLSKTLPGYLLFASQLRDVFFKNLQAATTLKLQASPVRLPGLEGQLHGTMGLRSKDLPHLQRLELRNVFIGHELVRFLSARSQTLVSLTLDHCLCSPKESIHHKYAKEGISWANLFRTLRESETRLAKMEILPKYAALTQDEIHGADCQPSKESKTVKHIRQRLRQDSTLRVFGYGDLYESESTPNHDDQLNIKAFLRGDDMEEYGKLMAVISENAAP